MLTVLSSRITKALLQVLVILTWAAAAAVPDIPLYKVRAIGLQQLTTTQLYTILCFCVKLCARGCMVRGSVSLCRSQSAQCAIFSGVPSMLADERFADSLSYRDSLISSTTATARESERASCAIQCIVTPQ